MFIKEGRHADGMEFHSAGLEKAHAFSPSHGEIHFNDWEHYSIEEKDKSVSLFFRGSSRDRTCPWYRSFNYRQRRNEKRVNLYSVIDYKSFMIANNILSI